MFKAYACSSFSCRRIISMIPIENVLAMLFCAPFRAHLQALYAKLIAPLERLLNRKNLLVVPYGPLHSLPFHALYDGSKYLIDRLRSLLCTKREHFHLQCRLPC